MTYSPLTSEQKKALDPTKSLWVTASAGSGKTKVLTDRMIRLMVQGIVPHRLLCLTFTKKAAMEMHQRLYLQLAHWEKAPLEDLALRLTDMIGRPPSEEEAQRTRSLYGLFLRMPPQIQTFHSFCQSLIQRFPREDGILKTQLTLDEHQSLRLWRQAYSETFASIDPASQEGQAALRLAKRTFQFSDELEELYHTRLSHQPLTPSLPEEIDPFSPGPLPPLGPSERFEEKDQALLEELQRLPRLSPAYLRFFMTQSGAPRKRIFKHPSLHQWALQEQTFLYHHSRHQAEIEARRHQEDLYTLFRPILKRYESLKKGRHDFDDLTLEALRLLEDPRSMGWVAQGLHHMIDHLLVDEAQDTNSHQWRLFRHLVETLVTGGPKTVFVVGDPKQSIYSFQGANIDLFFRMKEFTRAWCAHHKAGFEEISLSTSFRSTQAVLTVVNTLFQNTPLTHEPFPLHHTYHTAPGLVEFQVAEELTPEALAYQWVCRIQEWIKAPFLLETQGRLLKPHDIMILLPRRTAVFEALYQELSQCGLMKVSEIRACEHPVVRELIMIGQWILCPHDDEALLAVLQGPFFQAPSDLLLALAWGRGKHSLWARLKRLAAALPQEKLLQESEFSRKSSFHLDFLTPSLKESHLAEFQRLKRYLDHWRKSYQDSSLFSFYHTLLYASGGCRLMSQRFGEGVQEAADAFLHLLDHFEDKENLASFLFWLKSTEVPLKIQAGLGVQLMTIHSAKGLQSPVVILPDLPPPFSSSADLSSKELKGNRAQEYWRLLYVAVTRAQDHLYLSSRSTKGWYKSLEACMASLGKSFDAGTFLHGLKPEEQVPPPASPPALVSPPEWLFQPLLSSPPLSTPPREDFLHEGPLHPLLCQILDEFTRLPPNRPRLAAYQVLLQKGVVEADFWADRLGFLLTCKELQEIWKQGQGEVTWSTSRRIFHFNRLLTKGLHFWILQFTSQEPGQAPPSFLDVQPLKALHPSYHFHVGILWLRDGKIQWAPDNAPYPYKG